MRPGPSRSASASSRWYDSRSPGLSASRSRCQESAIGAVPVTKNVQRTVYQTRCTTVMWTKEVTRMVPQCVTEMVPVTRMIPVVEQQICYVTQRDPGHADGPGGDLSAHLRPPVRRRLRPVRGRHGLRRLSPRHDLRRAAGAGHRSRWSDTCPETIQVPRQRTKYTPVKETIQVRR